MKTGFIPALSFSVLMHLALVAMLSFSFGWRHFNPASAPAAPLAIEATVVDESLIQGELDRLAAIDAARIEAEDRRQRELDRQAAAARAEREREQERLAQLERQSEQAEAEARVAAERRERQRLETETAQAAEKRQLAELEQARFAENERLAKLERARKEEEQRLAELAEQRRIQAAEAAERERKARLAAERERAEAARKAEAEEQLRLAMAEERARRDAVDSGLLGEYQELIRQRIVRNWSQPPSARPGLKCELLVTQIPGGDVTDVEIVSCNGDAAVLRSIEAAVYKASPLPPPGDPRLFERKVRVFFEPDK